MIIGIDPSLVATGVCFGDNEPHYKLFGSKPTPPDVRSRIARFDDLATRIASFVEARFPTVIYIEFYSLHSKSSGTSSICEFGGILRRELTILTQAPIFEVPPTTLKKFFTGKGNAMKFMMLDNAKERYNQQIDNDNLADAFALWRLGSLVHMDYPNVIDQIEDDGLDHYLNPDKFKTRRRPKA